MMILVSMMDIATGMRSFASKRRGDNLQRRSWAVLGIWWVYNPRLWSVSLREVVGIIWRYQYRSMICLTPAGC